MLFTIPLELLLLFTTTTTTVVTAHALPPSPSRTIPDLSASARQSRISAFNAQTPLHTTALLAGAAAAPTLVPHSKYLNQDCRRGQLPQVTRKGKVWVNVKDSCVDLEGEGDEDDWISLDDLLHVVRGRREQESGDDVGGDDREDDDGRWGYSERFKQKVIEIKRREGWDVEEYEDEI